MQLADFGFSKDARQQSEAKTRVGTPAYLAPEVLQAQAGKTYDAQVSAGSGDAVLFVCVLRLILLPLAFPLPKRHHRDGGGVPFESSGMTSPCVAARGHLDVRNIVVRAGRWAVPLHVSVKHLPAC